MKILLTGSNTRQCNLARLNNKRAFDAQILNRVLKTFADVDFMPADKNTDYDKYDVVISGYGAMGGPAYPYLLQALYAIGKSDRAIVFFEDWKGPLASSEGLKSTYERGYDRFVEKVFNKKWGNGTRFYKGTDGAIDPETTWRGIEKLYKQPRECMYLILAFDWGDKHIVSDYLNIPYEHLLWYDESPYFIEDWGIKDMPYNPNRKRKFFYAGLTNQDAWLKKQNIFDLTDCFGPPPYEKIPTEAGVNQKHNEYLGNAIPEYYHGGCGWQRLRYIYGAMAKNVFMLGDRDAKALGITPVPRIDDFTDKELEENAMHTYETIKKYIPTKEAVCEHLKGQIENAVKLMSR